MEQLDFDSLPVGTGGFTTERSRNDKVTLQKFLAGSCPSGSFPQTLVECEVCPKMSVKSCDGQFGETVNLRFWEHSVQAHDFRHRGRTE